MSLVIAVLPGDESAMKLLEGAIRARGADVQVLTAGLEPGISPGSIPSAAALLARHGVTVIVDGSSGECTAGAVKADAADLLEPGSLDAFLRRLELAGLVPPPAGEEIACDEENLIRERLQKLGYL